MHVLRKKKRVQFQHNLVNIGLLQNLEQRHSPSQDAVIRVHSRIAEIGFEPGSAVVARLLVHSQQIGYLFGKGGIIIPELRRVTGASIRIFPKEQFPKYGSQNDEVVQVVPYFKLLSAHLNLYCLYYVPCTIYL